MKNPEINKAENVEITKTNLAQKLIETASHISFGCDRELRPINSAELAEAVKQSGLHLDYRSPLDTTEEIASVLDGLDFDHQRLRSQAFCILENEKPIGIITFLIAPKIWMQKQRYFKKEYDGVRIMDFAGMTGEETPDFCFIPGWTKVADEYRGKLAFPGYKLLDSSIKIISEAAPENTWIEVSAMGLAKKQELDKIYQLARQFEPGSIIKQADLPFDIDIIGKNNEGSKATVKLAQKLALEQIENVGASRSLGPIFSKKIK